MLKMTIVQNAQREYLTGFFALSGRWIPDRNWSTLNYARNRRNLINNLPLAQRSALFDSLYKRELGDQ